MTEGLPKDGLPEESLTKDGLAKDGLAQTGTSPGTERLLPDAAGIAAAARIIAAGGIVAFPTETVYGLGADATDGSAVARVYAAKGRPAFNPLIAHVADRAAAEALCVFDADARALADAFWPGPLTLVLPLRRGQGDAPVAGPARGAAPDAVARAISPLVTAGLPTLAVRVPAHPVARALLAAVGRPVAAPSANPSGRISPTSADHVIAGLAGRIDAVLDGGAAAVGVESTIVCCTGGLRANDTAAPAHADRTTPRPQGADAAGQAGADAAAGGAPAAGPVGRPVILRAGGITAEAIGAVLGYPVGTAPETAGAADAARTSPGQLLSHYAPRGTLRLGARHAGPGETLLGFGEIAGDITLSASGDLTEAAANLFACLHRLDAMGAGRIAVAPVPDSGLGRAINDRLRRAAAPRAG